jgi:hypothetical protein
LAEAAGRVAGDTLDFRRSKRGLRGPRTTARRHALDAECDQLREVQDAVTAQLAR